jgi:glycosyltransferase involved in cell wall biosynthesis
MQLSVIVPVFEHWDLVPNLLHCIQQQTISPSEFEVILVDNGSTDFNPPKILPDNTFVLKAETPGSYAARNHGAAYAHGEYMVFTDADCLPKPDWLSNFQRIVQSLTYQSQILAGRVEVTSISSNPNIWEIYDIVKGIPQEQYVLRGYGATANLLIPKLVFDKLGGFDSKRYSSGDAELCRRAGAQGYSISLVSKAIVQHPARNTWPALVTKTRRLKGGQLRNGSLSSRLIWLMRLFKSLPVTPINFMLDRRHPIKYRVSASIVYLALWVVEIQEAIKLLIFQSVPERR